MNGHWSRTTKKYVYFQALDFSWSAKWHIIGQATLMLACPIIKVLTINCCMKYQTLVITACTVYVSKLYKTESQRFVNFTTSDVKNYCWYHIFERDNTNNVFQ